MDLDISRDNRYYDQIRNLKFCLNTNDEHIKNGSSNEKEMNIMHKLNLCEEEKQDATKDTSLMPKAFKGMLHRSNTLMNVFDSISSGSMQKFLQKKIDVSPI